MDERKRDLKGSPLRDEFKRCHKELRRDFYATDADLALVSKTPPGTVAYLDYKYPSDSVSFAEAIQYNEWMRHAPVYIVESYNPTTGPFIIKRYLGADWHPDPPEINWGEIITLANWAELEGWEGELRREYQCREGWKGYLRGCVMTSGSIR